jgi:hypothetical protein
MAVNWSVTESEVKTTIKGEAELQLTDAVTLKVFGPPTHYIAIHLDGSWDECRKRTFHESLDDAPRYVLKALREAVSVLEAMLNEGGSDDPSTKPDD